MKSIHLHNHLKNIYYTKTTTKFTKTIPSKNISQSYKRKIGTTSNQHTLPSFDKKIRGRGALNTLTSQGYMLNHV